MSFCGRSNSLFLSLAFLVGCKKEAPPTPAPEPAPVVESSAKPSPSASAQLASRLLEQNAPSEIPTWVPEKVSLQGARPEGLYVLESGELLVHEGNRVGRVVDDHVEWLKEKAPERSTALGRAMIKWVGGRFPDAVDLIYHWENGRAAEPTFVPLTGKGSTIVYADGGGWGDIVGIARLGESTLIAGVDLYGTKFATVRGPGVIRGRKGWGEGGCKAEAKEKFAIDESPPAIKPRAFGATGAGTVLSFGELCDDSEHPAVEIWDKDQKTSRILDLKGEKNLRFDYLERVYPGKGDEAFLRAYGEVIHYIEGRVERLPALANGAGFLFMSPNGKLYASSEWELHRWDGDKWTQLAHFAWPIGGYAPGFVADAKEQIWKLEEAAIARMKEGKGTVFQDGCTTPFVYLYEVSPDNKPDFTFPTTRKALSSFPEASELGLVEVYESRRRLGVIAKSKAQAEAVIAHLKEKMPKEKPRLMCYEPVSPRKIDLGAK